MAPSNVVPAAEATHAGAAAEEAAHPADEEDETAMEGARVVFSTTSESADSRRVGSTSSGAHATGRGRNAGHKLLLAAEQDHVIDTVTIDFAFFGEHDQTAKLVLILCEHCTHFARLHTRNFFSCVWLKIQMFVLQHFCARHPKNNFHTACMPSAHYLIHHSRHFHRVHRLPLHYSSP